MNIWFHEDDAGLIELLPAAALDFARRQAAECAAFAREHRADGAGWTAVFLLKEPPEPLTSLKIPLEDLKALAPAGMTRFDQVASGITSTVEPAPQALAWGVSQREFVFAEFDEAGLVEHIWLSQRYAPATAHEAELMTQFFAAASALWPMILVDWNEQQIGDASDRAFLRAYFGFPAAP